MNFSAKVVGAGLAKAELKSLAKELGRDFTSLVSQEARSLAVELGRLTPPVGLRESDGDGLKRSIESQIIYLFPSLDDGKRGASRIYRLLEQANKRVADDFWLAYREGRREDMEKILARRIQGVPRGIKKSSHVKARKSGNVRKGGSIAIATVSSRASYIKREQKRVGLAKAGWLGVAKSLGGRVRQGGGRQGGTRSTFPSWVRKAGARQKIGSAGVSSNGGKIRITLRNPVRYVRDSLSFSTQLKAERQATRNFRIALTNAKKFRTRRVSARLRKGR